MIYIVDLSKNQPTLTLTSLSLQDVLASGRNKIFEYQEDIWIVKKAFSIKQSNGVVAKFPLYARIWKDKQPPSPYVACSDEHLENLLRTLYVDTIIQQAQNCNDNKTRGIFKKDIKTIFATNAFATLISQEANKVLSQLKNKKKNETSSPDQNPIIKIKARIKALFFSKELSDLSALNEVMKKPATLIQNVRGNDTKIHALLTLIHDQQQLQRTLTQAYNVIIEDPALVSTISEQSPFFSKGFEVMQNMAENLRLRYQFREVCSEVSDNPEIYPSKKALSSYQDLLDTAETPTSWLPKIKALSQLACSSFLIAEFAVMLVYKLQNPSHKIFIQGDPNNFPGGLRIILSFLSAMLIGTDLIDGIKKLSKVDITLLTKDAFTGSDIDTLKRSLPSFFTPKSDTPLFQQLLEHLKLFPLLTQYSLNSSIKVEGGVSNVDCAVFGTCFQDFFAPIKTKSHELATIKHEITPNPLTRRGYWTQCMDTTCSQVSQNSPSRIESFSLFLEHPPEQSPFIHG